MVAGVRLVVDKQLSTSAKTYRVTTCTMEQQWCMRIACAKQRLEMLAIAPDTFLARGPILYASVLLTAQMLLRC